MMLIVSSVVRVVISIRDLLSWTHFINTTAVTVQEELQMDITDSTLKLAPPLAYIHGACLVFLDALGCGVTSVNTDHVKQIRAASLKFLCEQMSRMTGQDINMTQLGFVAEEGGKKVNQVRFSEDRFGIGPFSVPLGRSIETFHPSFKKVC
jgi:midasin